MHVRHRRALAPRVVSWLSVLAVILMTMPAVAKDKVTYYLTDSLHSVVVELDAQRNVLSTTHYGPYGLVLDRSMRDGPGYGGHEEDPATGLNYMQQRYYDPQAGRFVSADAVLPTADGGNFNRYWYAADNPYRYTDPDGRSFLTFLAGLEYETYSLITGHGFHGGRLVGALKDGYNGEGSGVAGAIKQDAGLVLAVATVGMAGPEVGTAEAGEEVGAAEAAVDVAKASDGFPTTTGILRDAAQGKGNFGLGSTTTAQAEGAGKAWVGEGFRVGGDGKTLISRDGLRQWRPPSYKPKLGKWQSNFESRYKPRGQWQSNGHLDITDQQ